MRVRPPTCGPRGRECDAGILLVKKWTERAPQRFNKTIKQWLRNIVHVDLGVNESRWDQSMYPKRPRVFVEISIRTEIHERRMNIESCKRKDFLQKINQLAFTMTPAVYQSTMAFNARERLAAVHSVAGLRVPYSVLPYERLLGRPFATHRESVGGLVGDTWDCAGSGAGIPGVTQARHFIGTPDPTGVGRGTDVKRVRTPGACANSLTLDARHAPGESNHWTCRPSTTRHQSNQL